MVKEHLYQSQLNKGPELRVHCPYPNCDETWSYPANFKILDKPLGEGFEELANIMKICCVHLVHSHFYNHDDGPVLTCWCGFKFSNQIPYLSTPFVDHVNPNLPAHRHRKRAGEALWQEIFDHFCYHGGMSRHYRLSVAKQALIEDTHNG